MAQREGSVYLYLFIATFVLFVAMVVLFFVENNKVNELREEVKKANTATETQKGLAQKYLAERDDLRSFVGGPEAAQAWPGEEHYKTKLRDAETFVNEMYKALENRTPKVYTDVFTAYVDYKDIITKILDTRKRAEELARRADEEKIAALQQTKEEVKKKDETIAGLKSTYNDAETKYNGRITELTRENERLQRELATTKDDITSKEITWNRERARVESILKSLQLRLEKREEELRKVKTLEDVEPDGQVIDVASSEIGWIDIGRKQHLRPGIDFQVFQTIKGGRRQYKGRIEIQQIEEKMSRFRIVELKDELNPITKGDYITSPFYDPKAVPIFVFAGEGLESKEITEETLRAKIKGYGALIKDEVDLSTSFVIALKDYDKSPLYGTARQLGVPILRERDILEFMGL